MADKPFKATKKLGMVVAKQVQAPTQKQVDDEFLRLIDGSIEKDKKLLKKLAKG